MKKRKVLPVILVGSIVGETLISAYHLSEASTAKKIVLGCVIRTVPRLNKVIQAVATEMANARIDTVMPMAWEVMPSLCVG
jgi:hypothetical protein